MRRKLSFVLLTMMAVGIVPALSSADHCDRANRGNGQIWMTSGLRWIIPGVPAPNELPDEIEGPIQDGWPNGIRGEGSGRFNLGGHGCRFEDPGRQETLTLAGQPADLPMIYDQINTNWITPGATHFTPWAAMDNGCPDCERPGSFVYQIDTGGGFGSEIAVPSVIWDSNGGGAEFRSRYPIALPSGTRRVRLEAYVDNTATTNDTTDKVTVSRIYGVCRASFGSGGSGLAAPVLNNVPSTNLCVGDPV